MTVSVPSLNNCGVGMGERPERALATQQMTMKPQMTVQSAVGDIGQTKANDDYDERQ